MPRVFEAAHCDGGSVGIKRPAAPLASPVAAGVAFGRALARACLPPPSVLITTFAPRFSQPASRRSRSVGSLWPRPSSPSASALPSQALPSSSSPRFVHPPHCLPHSIETETTTVAFSCRLSMSQPQQPPSPTSHSRLAYAPLAHPHPTASNASPTPCPPLAHVTHALGVVAEGFDETRNARGLDLLAQAEALLGKVCPAPPCTGANPMDPHLINGARTP